MRTSRNMCHPAIIESISILQKHQPEHELLVFCWWAAWLEQLSCSITNQANTSQKQKPAVNIHCSNFLATLGALHFPPVSHSLTRWAEFLTSVALRLASLFFLLLVDVIVKTDWATLVTPTLTTILWVMQNIAGNGWLSRDHPTSQAVLWHLHRAEQADGWALFLYSAH